MFKNISVLALVLSSSLSVADAAVNPDAIIQKVDDIRNPAENYAMQVEITTKDKPEDNSVFQVLIKGNTKTLIKTLEPARDRGRNMLMLAEEMWAYLPNLKRAVRISLSQRLTGQAANGDISRMRWTGDYDAKIESENDKQWMILLSAKKKGLTYDKVRVWVEKSSFRPIKADFLTPQGKPLKKAVYSNYKQLAGKLRPSEMSIQDAIRESDVSIIKITSMEVRQFPESLFNQNSLR